MCTYSYTYLSLVRPRWMVNSLIVSPVLSTQGKTNSAGGTSGAYDSSDEARPPRPYPKSQFPRTLYDSYKCQYRVSRTRGALGLTQVRRFSSSSRATVRSLYTRVCMCVCRVKDRVSAYVIEKHVPAAAALDNRFLIPE